MTDMKFENREDPFGGENECKPLDELNGKQKEPIDIGESEVIKNSKMNFSGEVAEKFEDLVISRQIPGYDNMRHRVLSVANYMTQPNTTFADIGTSQGRMLRDIIGEFAHHSDDRLGSVTFYGLDYVNDMLDQARTLISELREQEEVKSAATRYANDNFVSVDSVPQVALQQHDLRNGLPKEMTNCSVIASVLTLQFVPIEHRPRVIQDIYNALVPGGAFIFVEKVLVPNVHLDDMMTKLYYKDKSRQGVKPDDIIRKRESLEYSLMPYTSESNDQLMEAAGFRQHDIATFWSDLNFQAKVAVKR